MHAHISQVFRAKRVTRRLLSPLPQVLGTALCILKLTRISMRDYKGIYNNFTCVCTTSCGVCCLTLCERRRHFDKAQAYIRNENEPRRALLLQHYSALAGAESTTAASHIQSVRRG